MARDVANPQRFEGRENDIARLGELFESRNVVWITGPPGIGKTALAGRFLRQRGLEGKARSFDVLAGATLQDLMEGVNTFLVEQDCRGFEGVLKAPGLKPGQRIAGLMRALGTGQWAVVLESHEEVAEREDFAQLLTEAEQHLSGSRMILTSQQPPGWAIADREVQVRGLAPEASRKVLAALGITEGWERIHEAVQGCPKGLEVAAPLVKRAGIEVALRAASRGKRPALGLYEEVFARVSPAARRMWVMLAMLPGTVARDAVLEMWGSEDGVEAWAELVECAVLDPRNGRWEMHSLARATGERKRWGQRRWRKECGRRIARFYARFAAEKREDRAAVEGELENVLAAARLAFRYREWEVLWQIGDRVVPLLLLTGRWATGEDLVRLYGEGARGAKEPARELLSLGELGNLAYRRGDLAAAEERYAAVLTAAQTRQMRKEEGKALHQLGMVAQDRGELEEAEGYYNQSLEIKRELGDRPGEAKTLHQLGMVGQDRGKLEEAEGYYNQSLEIEREIGDRPGEAETLHQLGTLAETRGELEEAEGLYKESLEIAREVGDRPGEAITLAQMALLAEEQGDLRLAVERMERACAMMEEMGLGEREEAREHLERLRRRLEEAAGVAPDVVSYSTLISKAPSYEEAERWFEEMKAAGVAPNVVSFSTLISKAPGYEEAKEWVDEMAVAGLGASAYNLLISRAPTYEEAKALLGEMVAGGIAPTAGTYHALIDRAPDGEEAKALLEEMMKAGLVPNEKTYNALMGKGVSREEADRIAGTRGDAAREE